jgi:hypothetical protein
MSVGPVQPPGSTIDRNPGEKLRAAPPRPVSENRPAPETAKLKSGPPVPSIPEDEVEVQWDNQIKDEMIYQFRDGRSGALVLQVPSEEVLNVAHGIDEEFLKESAPKQVSAPPARGEGGKI